MLPCTLMFQMSSGVVVDMKEWDRETLPKTLASWGPALLC